MPEDLAASRCDSCSHLSSPPQGYCPEGCGDTMVETVISPEGVLYASTVIHVPHPEFGERYQVGYADHPEGPRLFGHVEADALVEPGTRVRVALELSDDDEVGRRVRTRFVPHTQQEVGA